MRRNFGSKGTGLYFSDVFNAKHLSIGNFPPRLKFNGFDEFFINPDLKAEAINNQRFLEAQKSLVRDQLAITNAQREAAGLPAITIENLTADFTDAVTQAQNILDSLTAQEGLLDTILSERLKQNQKIAELEEEILNLQNKIYENELEIRSLENSRSFNDFNSKT